MFSALTIALAALSLSLTQYQTAQASIEPPTEVTRPQMTTEEQAITKMFPDAPIMLKVASCESGMRQHDEKGNTITNGTGDYGILQIRGIHIAEAKKLGFDIFTLEGNLGYARYLYDRHNLSPWLSSFDCWSQNDKTIGHTEAIEGNVRYARYIS